MSAILPDIKAALRGEADANGRWAIFGPLSKGGTPVPDEIIPDFIRIAGDAKLGKDERRAAIDLLGRVGVKGKDSLPVLDGLARGTDDDLRKRAPPFLRLRE